MLKGIINVLNKCFKIIKNEGFYVFILRLKKQMKKIINKHKASIIKRPLTVNEVGQALFGNIEPINTISTTEKTLRINIVTDTLNKGALYGGVATSVIFAIILANRLNCPLRIITRDGSTDASSFLNIARLHKLTVPAIYNFYSAPYGSASENSNLLPVSEQDIFISTSWWSSHAVREINMRNKYLYILQEYEKIFYPNSDQHVMADAIFNDKNMLPIVNTKVLYDFYGLNNYQHIHNNGLYFEPAFPHITPLVKDLSQRKAKLNLFFYYRPQMPRNLSFIGLNLLDTAIERGIIRTEDWNIYLAGQKDSLIQFCNGYIPKNYGKLDWDNYSSFIANVDLCVAFMLAPCPSYIPLDLACSKAVVLTNTYKNKTQLDYYSENIICSDLEMESMLENLQKAINLAKNSEQRHNNFINNKINKDWNVAFSEVAEKIASKIHNNEI